jgi:hypothetical protein
MAFGEGRLDCRLADRQPVECAVELVLVDHPETELLAKAGGRRVRRQRPGGGKLGTRIEDAANGEGQDEVTAAIAVWAKQPIEADPARRAEGRVDMTMRNERMMVMASWSWGMTVPPLSSVFKPAIRSCGQSERFKRVRFLTLPASR